MAGYRLTREATDDLVQIWKFIARDEHRRRRKSRNGDLQRLCIGQLRKHSTKLLVRFWTVTRFPNFVLLYRPDTKPLRIIRILHGKRNIPRVLKQQNP